MATDTRRRAYLIGLVSAGAAGASWALTPRRRASQMLPPIDLKSQVPVQFGRWRLDSSIMPILPDPSVQARLDQIYTQLVARTYIDNTGQRVMLSIAYGADQGSDATAAHRPEFCYVGQGFTVQGLGEQSIRVGDHQVGVRRLLGRMGSRVEPITYWVTLNDRAVLPGIERKLEQIRIGLLGVIPDGMLVRVSSIQPNVDAAFGLQDSFIAELAGAMDASLRARYFGGAA